MRITNFHLIVSFLVLSGLGFFGYQFYGPHLRVPSVPGPGPVVSRPAEDLEGRLREERERLEMAKRRSEKALERADAAVETAEEDGRDVSSLQVLREDARSTFQRAQRLPDFERVESLSEEIVRQALESPRKQLDRYVVQRGDNLWSISRKAEVYGRGAGWVKIWRANEKKIPDFDRLYSGQELAIPRQNGG